jgi:excisionase family DNA binding protein
VLAGSGVEAALRVMVDQMPAGAMITLPVDWLRVRLGIASDAPPRETAAEAIADLSVEEVASLMKRKPSTVRGWCASGALEAYRLQGRDWRVTRASLRAFQDRQRPARTTPSKRRRDVVDLGGWRAALPAQAA